MNKRVLTILVAVTVLVCAAAVATWYTQQPETGAEANPALFPGLGDKLNTVATVKLTGNGGRTVTVQRAQDDWTVAERGDYPADIGNIRSLLLGLSDVKLVEPETTKQDNYHYLGVQDVSRPDAPGVFLELKNADGKTLDAVIVGNKAGDRGRYVRKPGAQQSWLAHPMPEVPLDAAHWLNRDLVDIGPDQVYRVEVAPHKGPSFAIEKASPADGTYKLVEPKGKKLGREAAANPLGRSLANLRFTDVEDPAKAKEELADADRLRYETFSGWVVDLKVAKQDKGVSVTEWNVRFDPKLANRFLDAGDLKGEKREAALDKSRKEAEKLAARINGRAFTMPNYVAGRFEVSLDKLTKAPGS